MNVRQMMLQCCHLKAAAYLKPSKKKGIQSKRGGDRWPTPSRPEKNYAKEHLR